MGQNNPNPNKRDQSPVSAIAVTMTGRAPSAVVWQYTEADICEDVKNLLKPLVSDITDVTIEPYEKDKIMAYAWLSSNSDHVVDKSAKNMVINRPIHAYSKELKELMDKYCPKDQKRPVASDYGKLIGIPIDLFAVFRVLMDIDGKYAQDQVGNSVKSNLQLNATFRKSDDEKRGKLMYLEVIKTTKHAASRKPRPVRNMRY